MIVGVLTLRFRLRDNRSLKGKRQVAASLKQKLRNTFNVSVAEVEAMDSLDRLVLAAVTVANETKKVESRLTKAREMAEAVCPEELFSSSMEIFAAENGDEIDRAAC
jgi:uncharacterized protein YlxP (DUF503 family)